MVRAGLIATAAEIEERAKDNLFWTLVLRPFLLDLVKYQYRFQAPPYMHISGFIDIQAIRWVPADAPPDIEYYVAADRAGFLPLSAPSVNGHGPSLVKVWARCPVEVPQGIKALAREITESDAGGA